MKFIKFIVLSSYIALTVGFLAAVFFLSLNLISLVSYRDKMKNNDKVQSIKMKTKNIWNRSVHSKHVQEFCKWIWFQKAENFFNQNDRCFCFIFCCKKSFTKKSIFLLRTNLCSNMSPIYREVISITPAFGTPITGDQSLYTISALLLRNAWGPLLKLWCHGMLGCYDELVQDVSTKSF